MNIYLTDKEREQLIAAVGNYLDMMSTTEEDLISDVLEDGLGSALYKLYKGRYGQKLYKKYCKTNKKV